MSQAISALRGLLQEKDDRHVRASLSESLLLRAASNVEKDSASAANDASEAWEILGKIPGETRDTTIISYRARAIMLGAPHDTTQKEKERLHLSEYRHPDYTSMID